VSGHAGHAGKLSPHALTCRGGSRFEIPLLEDDGSEDDERGDRGGVGLADRDTQITAAATAAATAQIATSTAAVRQKSFTRSL